MGRCYNCGDELTEYLPNQYMCDSCGATVSIVVIYNRGREEEIVFSCPNLGSYNIEEVY